MTQDKVMTDIHSKQIQKTIQMKSRIVFNSLCKLLPNINGGSLPNQRFILTLEYHKIISYSFPKVTFLHNIIMGIKCIRPESPQGETEPKFLYQNMVQMKKNTDPHTEFEFLERIGKGSFSEVFRVRSLLTNNIHAMKKIERRKNIRLEKMIINEFNILRQLDHPNIMKMHQYLEDNDHIYILAEMCPGKELFDVIIENKYFSQAVAKKIFYDIVGAVRYMHQSHFMHRDLKPENIMYDSPSGTLKIVDLGSALQFSSSDCVERKRVGTSYYIAPEVLSRCYNQKCDVWSLGVILYILLSGEPPFKGSNDAQILQRVKEGNLQFKKSIWSLISQDAKKLIKQMLTKNVKERIDTEVILKNKWFETIGQQKLRVPTNEKQQKNMINCLSNMKSYKDIKSKSLQDGIITFIVNFVKSSQDAIQLQSCFKALDLNGDGVLSLQQMTQGMMKYLKTSRKEAAAVAEAVFKKIDTNRSGSIDYSEFVIAATNFEIVISEQNLDIAFDYLDTDKSGKISASQLKQRLGNNIPEQAYQNMMKSYDQNSDGEISREQFRVMMKRLINEV